MTGLPFEIRLTPAARRDLAAILRWSRSKFGSAAAARYRTLVVRALRDIADDPGRPGSKARPEILIDGARTYHLALSRDNVKGPKVRAPRHFVLYRRREDRVIEVARFLHDATDLQRHVPATYRGQPSGKG